MFVNSTLVASSSAIPAETTTTSWDSIKDFFQTTYQAVEDFECQQILVWLFIGALFGFILVALSYLFYDLVIYLKYGPPECIPKPKIIEHDFDWLQREAERLGVSEDAKMAADKAWRDAIPKDHYYIHQEPLDNYITFFRRFYTVGSPRDHYHLVDSTKKRADLVSSTDDSTDEEREKQLRTPYQSESIQQDLEYRESKLWWIFRPRETPKGVRYVYSWKEPVLV